MCSGPIALGLRETMDSSATFELLREAMDGDRESMSRLEDKYGRRLYALVDLRLGAALREYFEVDDVCQETWLKAVKSIPRFRFKENGSFMSWLGGIAEHVIMNWARWVEIHHTSPLPGLNPGSSGLGQDPKDPNYVPPLEVIVSDERFQRLKKGLLSLRKDHREVIILVLVQELSMKDAALRLDRSVDATQMLLLRALRKLRRALGESSRFELPPGSIQGLCS